MRLVGQPHLLLPDVVVFGAGLNDSARQARAGSRKNTGLRPGGAPEKISHLEKSAQWYAVG